MKIVCISDTHCQLSKVQLPYGDILVHAGDLTYQGTIQETSKELFQLSSQLRNFTHVILIEGNHDWLGARNSSLMNQMCADNGITLLRDSEIVIDGVKFYGSPWQPEFGRWAFNLRRGQELRDKWNLIPNDTNVLITHGPPMSILDGVEKFIPGIGEFEIEHVGCMDLHNRVMSHEMKDLKLHVFGHIHQAYGKKEFGTKTFINPSICTESYKPTNAPIVFEL